MKFTNVNDVKIYNVNTGKSIPEWLSERKKRALLKKDVELQQRIQLIQDFDMPTAATRIKMTSNQQYIMASGVYKPKLKCFETAELGVKFERSLDCEVVQFQMLSEDFRKVVFLQADRYVEFHAHFGRYFKTRIPRHGRDMSYHSGSCDLYLCGSSNEIWRLNLESGRFMAPLQGKGPEYNVVKISPAHQLITTGSTTGSVEVWDPRTKDMAAGLRLPTEEHNEEVTALRYSSDGLTMAAGTSAGKVYVYDIRTDKPYVVKDHQYGYPIVDLKFHSSRRVLSTDKKVIKIWDQYDGENYTAIESQTDINDTCLVDDTGLIMTANEGSDMNAYFIPDLGPAPKWCHFLDTISEELEQTESAAVYDDYKFVTKKDLEELGLVDLIGSRLLQPYMHGFYIDMRLYQKAKAVADPFSYKDYRKETIKKKINEKRANRIGVVKKLPKINTDYAKYLMQEDAKSTVGEKSKVETNALKDDRFSSLWSNPKFTVDAESEEFKARHPKLAKKQYNAESFKLIERDSEDDEREGRGSDESSSESEDEEEVKPVKKEKPKKVAAPKMYEVNTADMNANKRKMKMALGSRVDSEAVEVQTHAAHVGGRVHTFKLHQKVDHVAEEKEIAKKEHMKERRDARRGVKSLNLKRRGPVYWRGQKVDG
eukprot:CFRG3100T1